MGRAVRSEQGSSFGVSGRYCSCRSCSPGSVGRGRVRLRRVTKSWCGRSGRRRRANGPPSFLLRRWTSSALSRGVGGSRPRGGRVPL